MFDVIQEAHSADIYDNSGARPRFAAAKIDKILYVCEKPPKWLEKYFISKATEKNLEVTYFTCGY